MKKQWFQHIPTGWIYYKDGVSLKSPGNKNGTIPASIAQFGTQKDWVEIPEPSIDDILKVTNDDTLFNMLKDLFK